MCGRASEYVCGRCESQGYCTEACQEEHWAGHREVCKKILSLATPTTPGVAAAVSP